MLQCIDCLGKSDRLHAVLFAIVMIPYSRHCCFVIEHVFHGVKYKWFLWSMFLAIKFVCIDVTICDLVYDARTVHGLC